MRNACVFECCVYNCSTGTSIIMDEATALFSDSDKPTCTNSSRNTDLRVSFNLVFYGPIHGLVAAYHIGAPL